MVDQVGARYTSCWLAVDLLWVPFRLRRINRSGIFLMPETFYKLAQL